jgi:uncharacterized membrane protein (UPF0182 family)
MYLRASGESSIPEVKRIIVSYSDKIILADSVENALMQLFQYQESEGQTGGETGTPTALSEDQLAKMKEAKTIYDKAIEAQKNGDWTGYGSYIQQLGELLQQLNQ